MKCYGKDSGAKVRTFFESTKFFMLKLKKTKTCLSFLFLRKPIQDSVLCKKRTPRRWVDLHVQILQGACLTLHLIPGGSLPSVAHFRFGCDAKVRRIFVISKFIVLKKRKYTNILVESCGDLEFYLYLCKR